MPRISSGQPRETNGDRVFNNYENNGFYYHKTDTMRIINETGVVENNHTPIAKIYDYYNSLTDSFTHILVISLVDYRDNTKRKKKDLVEAAYRNGNYLVMFTPELDIGFGIMDRDTEYDYETITDNLLKVSKYCHHSYQGDATAILFNSVNSEGLAEIIDEIHYCILYAPNQPTQILGGTAAAIAAEVANNEDVSIVSLREPNFNTFSYLLKECELNIRHITFVISCKDQDEYLAQMESDLAGRKLFNQDGYPVKLQCYSTDKLKRNCFKENIL